VGGWVIDRSGSMIADDVRRSSFIVPDRPTFDVRRPTKKVVVVVVVVVAATLLLVLVLLLRSSRCLEATAAAVGCPR